MTAEKCCLQCGHPKWTPANIGENGRYCVCKPEEAALSSNLEVAFQRWLHGDAAGPGEYEELRRAAFEAGARYASETPALRPDEFLMWECGNCLTLSPVGLPVCKCCHRERPTENGEDAHGA